MWPSRAPPASQCYCPRSHSPVDNFLPFCLSYNLRPKLPYLDDRVVPVSDQRTNHTFTHLSTILPCPLCVLLQRNCPYSYLSQLLGSIPIASCLLKDSAPWICFLSVESSNCPSLGYLHKHKPYLGHLKKLPSYRTSFVCNCLNFWLLLTKHKNKRTSLNMWSMCIIWIPPFPCFLKSLQMSLYSHNCTESIINSSILLNRHLFFITNDLAVAKHSCQFSILILLTYQKNLAQLITPAL